MRLAQHTHGRSIAIPQAAERSGKFDSSVRLIALARLINIIGRRTFAEQTRCEIDIRHHALAVFLPRSLIVAFKAKRQGPRETEPSVGHVAGIMLRVVTEKQRRLLVFAGQKVEERDVETRAHVVLRIGFEQKLSGLRRVIRAAKMPLAKHDAEQGPQHRPRLAVNPPLYPGPAQQGAVDFLGQAREFQAALVVTGMKFQFGQLHARRTARWIDFRSLFQRGTPLGGRAQTQEVAHKALCHVALRNRWHALRAFEIGEFRLQPRFVRRRIDQLHLRFPIAREIFPFLRNPLGGFPDQQLVRHTEIVEVPRHPLLGLHLIDLGKNFRRDQRLERGAHQHENGRQKKILIDRQGAAQIHPAQRPDGRFAFQRLDHAAARSRAGRDQSTPTRCLRPSRSW